MEIVGSKNLPFFPHQELFALSEMEEEICQENLFSLSHIGIQILNCDDKFFYFLKIGESDETYCPISDFNQIKDVHFNKITIVDPFGCNQEQCDDACPLSNCLKLELALFSFTCDELELSSVQIDRIEGLWTILATLNFKKLIIDEINRNLLERMPLSCEELIVSYFEGPLPSPNTLLLFKKITILNGGEDVLFDSMLEHIQLAKSAGKMTFLEAASCGKLRPFHKENDFLSLYEGKGLLNKAEKYLFYKELNANEAIFLSQEQGIHRFRLEIVKNDFDSIFSVLMDFLQNNWEENATSWTESSMPLDFSPIYSALQHADKSHWHKFLTNFVAVCGLEAYYLDAELEAFEALTLTNTEPADFDIDWNDVFDEPY